MARESFPIGSVRVRAGRAQNVELPLTRTITGAENNLPVRVVHGRQDGPVVWVSAAVHGDEVVGVEVIRRLLKSLDPKEFCGTLIAVPIVNVLGFMTGDRYLPDRRDLNRSFPGSPRGSQASRLAHLFMTEVVAPAEVGIDLHTAADRRSNLPQVRADLDDPLTRRLAGAFGAPVMLHAQIRDGSLRQAARERGAKVLLYEGGEAMRFDEWAITPALAGVQRVLAELGMTPQVEPADPAGPPESTELRTSGWVRARRTGIVQMECELGQQVARGDRLAGLSDSFGRALAVVKADRDGIVVGRTEMPLVHAGDALVHIGCRG